MLDYAHVRDNLFGFVDRLQVTVREETARSLHEIREKLQEEIFNLVILGQFKRGKSTFINSLLGDNILPTAIVPLTSVVTILRYGPELKIEVRYLDERRETVRLESLADYITERGNPQNRKAVKEVTVYYPSDYLKGGVRIIDTPGVGSVYRHNTDVAYSYLPYVDAGIFIVSVDPPLSESEHRFLTDIQGYVDKLFFVLNKIDQVSREDQQESLQFTARILEKDLGTGRVKMYPLSARWALEGKKSKDEAMLEQSRLPEFERRLQEFLVHEKGIVFLKAVINNLLKVISDETISFQLEQEAVKLPVQELTRKISRFEEEMKIIQKDREQNQFLLKGYLNKIISQLDDEISLFKKEKLPVLQQQLEEEYNRRIERGGGDLRGELEQFVFDAIRQTFNAWRQQQTEKISSRLEEAHQDFAQKTNETIERILLLTSDIFELKLKPFTSVEKLSKKSDFYFMLKDDPVGLELIQLAARSALPRFLAKKMILKNMKDSVAELVDRHCGRVRYDLVNRLNQTVREFQKALNEKIDLTLDGIRVSFQKALAMNQSSKADVEKNLGDLSSRLGSISSLRDELTAFSAELNGDLSAAKASGTA
ncbi:MAG: dynamin family protein [Syntrophobacteraceae bacterium]|nr:dynamin family protein [Syntrophobacteraceae bacterium]